VSVDALLPRLIKNCLQSGRRYFSNPDVSRIILDFQQKTSGYMSDWYVLNVMGRARFVVASSLDY